MLEKAITWGFVFMIASSSPITSTPASNFAIKSKYATYAICEDNASEVAYIMNDHKLKENISKLKSFSEYAYNWNGNNAEPFKEQLITKTENILRNLSYQPDVFPTANNSIQIEYEKDNGEYLEFEIFDNGTVNMLRINEDETEFEKDNISLKEIIECVGDFYGIA